MTAQQIVEKYGVATAGKTCGEVLDELKQAGATELELDIIKGFIELMARLG